jgi:hypothetical protein
VCPEVALFPESDADADVVAADDVERQHNATDILFFVALCEISKLGLKVRKVVFRVCSKP